MNVSKTDVTACIIEHKNRHSHVHFGMEMGKIFGPFIMLTALSEGHVPLVQDLKPSIQRKLLSLSLFYLPSIFIAWCRLAGSILSMST